MFLLSYRRVFVDPLYKFYEKALDEDQGGGRKDYYTVMFSFDLITFLITVFGWSSFSVRTHNPHYLLCVWADTLVCLSFPQ